MLKHILHNVKINNLELVAKSRMNSSFSVPLLDGTYFLSRNLKFKNVYNNFHRFTVNNANAKLYINYENDFAFNIIHKEPLYRRTIISNEINTLEEFEDILSQNWRESSPTDIVKAFSSVKNFCIQNKINISDSRFDNVVDGLMDHCEKLTDEEILELLRCLSEYPRCDSYTSHNFHDVWSCLDDICCWKMQDWEVDKMLLFANVWYQLKLGKLGDFIFVLIDRLTKKADKLTKDQLVKVYFYFNVCRKRAVDFEYEYALQNQIDKMNVDEMAVVAMGYFKTKTKIKLIPIMDVMVQRVTENSETIHEIPLSAIAKILRLSKPVKILQQVQNMLDKLCEEIDRLSHMCGLHLALISTGLQTPHNKTLQKVSEKIAKDISNTENVRLKDIERLLNVLSMFDVDPKTDPDIYKVAYAELHREERLAESVLHPRCIPCSLMYLSLRNIYSCELMDRVLDSEFINETYGKGAKFISRETFSLDASIDVECPEYKGNRLLPQLKYKAAKWLTEFTPSYDQYKKITAADQLFLDTVDRVKLIVEDEKCIYIDHVLPHFTRADIILCKDKKTGKFVPPSGFENYVLGDIMVPVNDSSLKWFAIVVLGWNNTIRDSSLPLGNIIMKRRQLEKIGYHPVFVAWIEFLRLSKEDQVDYILRKLA